MKNKIHFPETIEKAINELQEFFESDLYTKFRPEHKIPTGKKGKIETWKRQDFFKNEKEFIEYLNIHFNILRKEINRLRRKK